ncbi:hypothetical protein EAI_07693 [Harpegnathos saltator]|uniref:Uncharacterized protein n=1 Tax=Harpegnathos saltator TaxID=610380 RepID=E2B4I2_HARSA|nr:hypothetical protein EAI_07693 [Harpegnathos saltator]
MHTSVTLTGSGTRSTSKDTERKRPPSFRIHAVAFSAQKLTAMQRFRYCSALSNEVDGPMGIGRQGRETVPRSIKKDEVWGTRELESSEEAAEPLLNHDNAMSMSTEDDDSNHYPQPSGMYWRRPQLSRMCRAVVRIRNLRARQLYKSLDARVGNQQCDSSH